VKNKGADGRRKALMAQRSMRANIRRRNDIQGNWIC
jgi:hypothetical protein